MLVALLAAFAWLLVGSNARSERQLEQRFADRGALAASFTRAYVVDLAARERRTAALRLSGATPDRAEFERIVSDLGFQAAVLLDADGRALQVWPRKLELLGEPISARYDHLRAAVTEGRIGVSDVVPSVVEGIPVVGVAVPYDTPQGRRVISGAFDLQRTPLGAYLDNYSPIAGSAAYIVGAKGEPITSPEAAASRVPSAAQRRLFRSAAQLPPGGHHIGREFVVVADIAGTPWRMVVTVPTASLYGPIDGPGRHLGWMLLGLFAIVGIAVLVLLRSLARKGAILALTAATRAALLDQERIHVERLRELDRMKDEFVALASHELRTPLTSVGGYLEMLLDDPDRLAPDQLTFLERIRLNSDRVLRLVNDLLELSRIENSELNLDLRRLSLSPIVRDAIQEHAPAAAAKNVTLDSSITGSGVVDGDATRLRQVIDNLLSNAIKYTPGDGRVTVSLMDTDDAILLTVRDTGIGIPEDERARLFERFFRASTARERYIQGTGLGLAITKAVIDAHAGSIAVTDATPGTTFVVTLPLAP